ncbi:hypothetical protein GCM10009111_07880 [Colwellia asteriadis]|uniref:Uncharacterized protein n=1 Tax=Colwellia asteriadis TaxID=517723 RepID=A0ABN1L4C5_9GAMM
MVLKKDWENKYQPPSTSNRQIRVLVMKTTFFDETTVEELGIGGVGAIKLLSLISID